LGVVTLLLVVNMVSIAANRIAPGWQLALAIGAAGVIWLVVSAVGVDVVPGVGYVVRGVVRDHRIPFEQVQAVEVVRTSELSQAVVVHSRLGSWLLVAPKPVLDDRFSDKADAIRRAWIDAGARPAAPGVEPWGPHPLAVHSVVLRPTPRQASLGAPPASSRFAVQHLVLFLTAWVVALAVATRPVGWALLVLPLPIFVSVMRGPRTIVRRDGVEVRRWIRTQFVPWSMVGAVSTSTRRYPRRAADVIAVGLVTPHGWIELPAPRGGLSAPDPLFWRKLQFVQDCWAANRGPMWIGPPPAPASPPAPSPPPPTSLP
jgi:hypothetical protein